MVYREVHFYINFKLQADSLLSCSLTRASQEKVLKMS